ncbi:dihydroxyacetone kinase [Xylanimonas oleitrophica]|uniref:Dihydroxyacetone kinase n=1 Tax=Xylanimonas oleitrophica TaxID=2607479 RepID=A0A2W5WUM3_9MICO|nr:DAK2 domain-containing protein [Xylanimonas oleitrophica]PZR55179.1 dihydroxyacetone kinase [Xylanimonas oleitrophica]
MSAPALDQHAILQAYADAAVAARDELTRLDQLAGDGDFGDNLREGLAAVRAGIEAAPGEPAFRTGAQVFLDEVGGTSGPLLGLLLQSVAQALGTAGAAGDERHAFADGVREGLAAIQRVGEAEVGDRTLVDALSPAADALAEGAGYADVARRARQGALDTADLRARQGRASYLGDRAKGAPDAGALGVALLFWAVARVAEPDADLGDPVAFVSP